MINFVHNKNMGCIPSKTNVPLDTQNINCKKGYKFNKPTKEMINKKVNKLGFTQLLITDSTKCVDRTYFIHYEDNYDFLNEAFDFSDVEYDLTVKIMNKTAWIDIAELLFILPSSYYNEYQNNIICEYMSLKQDVLTIKRIIFWDVLICIKLTIFDNYDDICIPYPEGNQLGFQYVNIIGWNDAYISYTTCLDSNLGAFVCQRLDDQFYIPYCYFHKLVV